MSSNTHYERYYIGPEDMEGLPFIMKQYMSSLDISPYEEGCEVIDCVYRCKCEACLKEARAVCREIAYEACHEEECAACLEEECDECIEEICAMNSYGCTCHYDENVKYACVKCGSPYVVDMSLFGCDSTCMQCVKCAVEQFRKGDFTCPSTGHPMVFDDDDYCGDINTCICDTIDLSKRCRYCIHTRACVDPEFACEACNIELDPYVQVMAKKNGECST